MVKKIPPTHIRIANTSTLNLNRWITQMPHSKFTNTLQSSASLRLSNKISTGQIIFVMYIGTFHIVEQIWIMITYLFTFWGCFYITQILPVMFPLFILLWNISFLFKGPCTSIFVRSTLSYLNGDMLQTDINQLMSRERKPPGNILHTSCFGFKPDMYNTV